MQVELDACTQSQRWMLHLDGSHFPGSQRVLRAGGGYINYLLGVFHQKHASSTVEERDHEYHDSSMEISSKQESTKRLRIVFPTSDKPVFCTTIATPWGDSSRAYLSAGSVFSVKKALSICEQRQAEATSDNVRGG